MVRLNFAHGSAEDHRSALMTAREAAGSLDRVVGGLADLPGPKMRTGPVPVGGVELRRGSVVVLTAQGPEASPERIPTTVPDLASMVQPSEQILLSDGAIRATVLRNLAGGEVEVRIERGGILRSLKGIHLPASERRIEAFTADDRLAMDAAIGMGIDYVGVSFVRDADDLERARSHARSRRSRAQIVAKIETRSAVANLEEIVAVADVVMVARGDLGIQFPMRDVPFLQKRIIGLCNRRGRPVITATEMLESMTTSVRPTRAEVADVANAVLDGTDAVMLSGETAIGDRPVEVVRAMHDIVLAADQEKTSRRATTEAMDASVDDRVSWAIARAAVQAAEDLDVAAIVCPTRSGATAKRVAAFRPRMPILGIAHDPKLAGGLALYWGVTPALVRFLPEERIGEEGVKRAADAAAVSGLAARGDLVAVVAGGPGPRAGSTDFVRIVRT